MKYAAVLFVIQVLLVPKLVNAQLCDYAMKDCICDSSKTVCYFNLVIEALPTFTSFELNRGPGATPLYRGLLGGIYYINSTTGSLVPNNITVAGQGRCSGLTNEAFAKNNCSFPMTVDGKTYRTVLAVNGLVPGPNLIVYYNQTMSVTVTNSLHSDSISVHWHGLHQKNTPWMDGVGGISHCPIIPGASFTYIFKASPSGTFWYHSHSGAQRTEGFFGALIIKEVINTPKLNLSPQEHILSLLDWQLDQSDVLYTRLRSKVGFFPSIPLGEVPKVGVDWVTYGADNTLVGTIPYWSGVINGLGRHPAVPYSSSRLSIFNVAYRDDTVNNPPYYRFRLIGAQSLFPYRVSISGHRLLLMAVDGFLIRPVYVDYIIIHGGERYDFALKPKNVTETGGKKDYLILAETLEVDLGTGVPPYPSLNHIAEAILHYGDDTDQPRSTSYSQISSQYSLTCGKSGLRPCDAVNCLFEKYHPSYNINCMKLTSLQLLYPTPANELPGTPAAHTIFLNFGFEGVGSAVNGRNFVPPTFPFQSMPKESMAEENNCTSGLVDCSKTSCFCTNIVNITQQSNVDMVFSAVGRAYNFAHPIHLHGHSFHVAGIYYGTYNPNTGFVTANNTDVTCKSDPSCTDPSWSTADPASVTVNSTTIRKDTIIVPPGGYVRIRFIADNPGYWLLHCHLEPHQIEGMSVLVAELPEQQNPPPAELNQVCGNFFWNVTSFDAKLAFVPAKAGGLSSASSVIIMLGLTYSTLMMF